MLVSVSAPRDIHAAFSSNDRSMCTGGRPAGNRYSEPIKINSATDAGRTSNAAAVNYYLIRQSHADDPSVRDINFSTFLFISINQVQESNRRTSISGSALQSVVKNTEQTSTSGVFTTTPRLDLKFNNRYSVYARIYMSHR